MKHHTTIIAMSAVLLGALVGCSNAAADIASKGLTITSTQDRTQEGWQTLNVGSGFTLSIPKDAQAMDKRTEMAVKGLLVPYQFDTDEPYSAYSFKMPDASVVKAFVGGSSISELVKSHQYARAEGNGLIVLGSHDGLAPIPQETTDGFQYTYIAKGTEKQLKGETVDVHVSLPQQVNADADGNGEADYDKYASRFSVNKESQGTMPYVMSRVNFPKVYGSEEDSYIIYKNGDWEESFDPTYSNSTILTNPDQTIRLRLVADAYENNVRGEDYTMSEHYKEYALKNELGKDTGGVFFGEIEGKFMLAEFNLEGGEGAYKNASFIVFDYVGDDVTPAQMQEIALSIYNSSSMLDEQL